MEDEMPDGAAVSAKLRQNGVSHCVTVPDWVQIGLHQDLVEQDGRGIKLVQTTTEDECFTIAAGLYIGGGKPVVVIQNQGLYAGLNALRAVGLDAGLPLVAFIGQFGREEANHHKSTRSSSRRIVRMLEPVLEAVEVPYYGIDGEADLAKIDEAFAKAEAESRPVAVIFQRNITLQY